MKPLLLLAVLLVPCQLFAEPPATCSVGAGHWEISTGSAGLYVCTSANTWTLMNPPATGLPSGLIALVRSGACPSGFAEVSELNGKMLFGTVAANKDVGDTGGDDTITPAGTNATVSAGTPAGTVAWPAGVPTFTGTLSTAIVNHTHGFTNARGATSGGATTTWSVGVSASDTSSTATTLLTGNPTSGGAASYTPVGTIAWPAGVPTFSGTALGTHGHTFTGTEFDNRSAYVKVIFCQSE